MSLVSKKFDDIEALNLTGAAYRAAYMLRHQFPSIRFTSGKRSLSDQAVAMAGNVVHDRLWINKTYAETYASSSCHQWVVKNPWAKSQIDIAGGLLGVLLSLKPEDTARISKHLTGEAFDVAPVVGEAGEAIKRFIRSLPGLVKFLDHEGGLIRWHCQF